MRLLLDTHTFLWFIEGSNQLSDDARDWIEDPTNERLLSIASLWEMAIKVSLGRLRLGMSLAQLVEREVRGNAIDVLEIRPAHLDEVSRLSFYHRDPFDRLIIAQSLVENIPVLGLDEAFENYPVELLWSRDSR